MVVENTHKKNKTLNKNINSILELETKIEHEEDIELKKRMQTRLKSTITKTKKLEKNIDSIIKVKKIRIFPNKEQSIILNNWIGTARFTYNEVVSDINMKYKHKVPLNVNFQNLRNNLTPKPDKVSPDLEWIYNTPKDIRAGAIKDYCDAYKITVDKLKKGKINFFSMKFRKRKRESQSIVIPSSTIKIDDTYNLSFYPTFFTKENKTFTVKEKNSIKNSITDKIEFDCRLKQIKPNIWHLYIPYTVQVKPFVTTENQGYNKIISLDPGVRSLFTYYTSDGEAGDIGNNNINRIIRLCIHNDKIKSSLKKEKKKITKWKKKKIYKNQFKISNLIDEIHYKTINFLCKNFNTIIIPHFQVLNMIKKITRKIKNKTVRMMLSWSHGKFRERLILKAKEYNTTIIVCDEEYTSKTCGNCGDLNETLGGKKVFKCKKCNIKINRDINGARNILMKSLKEYSIKKYSKEPYNLL